MMIVILMNLVSGACFSFGSFVLQMNRRSNRDFEAPFCIWLGCREMEGSLVQCFTDEPSARLVSSHLYMLIRCV